MIWQMSMEVADLSFFGRPFTLAALLVKPTLKQLVDLNATFARHLNNPYFFAFECEDSTMISLLAAQDIPHLIPGKRLFAPELGTFYQNTPSRTERRQQRVASRLSSTGRTIVSLAIIESTQPEQRATWTKPIKHHCLKEYLEKNCTNEPFSPSTFSRIFQQLCTLGFGDFVGKGPQKSFQFKPRDELWRQLFLCEVETVLQATTIFYPIEHLAKEIKFLYTGTSALAYCGNLDHPIIPQIAVERSEFLNWKNSNTKAANGKKIFVQLWRHLPAKSVGVSLQECINPIDLALTKHKTQDPREREVLAEILASYDLDDSIIWRTND
jgi:hypothetical protein